MFSENEDLVELYNDTLASRNKSMAYGIIKIDKNGQEQ